MALRRLLRVARLLSSHPASWTGLLHVAVLGLIFVLLPSLTVRAQAGHVHQWQAVDDLPVPTVNVENANPASGQLIAVSAVTPKDADHCQSQGAAAPCPFANNIAENEVRIVSWSDGGGGGSFGYVDELGQFVPSSDPARIDHYQCPSGEAYLTLSVTVEDIPQAVEPGTGNTVATYHDAPQTGGSAVHVGGYPAHHHAWEAVDNISPGTINMYPSTANPGDVVYVYWSAYPEYDRCVNYGCSFSGGQATNAIHGVAWSDGGAGGSFGYKDGSGQFVPTTNPALVTCYQCPPQGRAVDIAVTIDDIPTAVDPQTGETVATYDDQPITAHVTLQVKSIHQHQWDAVNNIPPPRLQRGGDAVAPGGVISVSADLSGLIDTDYCTAEGCSFYGSTAFNSIYLAGWSDGGAGGTFGYLDQNGQFVPSTDPLQITHYRANPSAAPGSVVTLTASADDVPQATSNSNYQTVATFDDAPATAQVQVRVDTAPAHVHHWDPASDLPQPQLYASATSAQAGEVIGIGASARNDTASARTMGRGTVTPARSRAIRPPTRW